ncbi:MAG: hypothetical protein NTX82_05030 [Candidatus Parcubacteria bacterium]|nr:hypothetical protein [Candidatus Parcubacteria bacterium]
MPKDFSPFFTALPREAKDNFRIAKKVVSQLHKINPLIIREKIKGVNPADFGIPRPC